MGYSERIVQQTVKQQQQQLLPCGGQIRADCQSRSRHTSCSPSLFVSLIFLSPAFISARPCPASQPVKRVYNFIPASTEQCRRGPFVSGGATGEQLLNVARAIELNALRGSEETQLLRRKTGPMCEFMFLSNPLVWKGLEQCTLSLAGYLIGCTSCRLFTPTEQHNIYSLGLWLFWKAASGTGQQQNYHLPVFFTFFTRNK